VTEIGVGHKNFGQIVAAEASASIGILRDLFEIEKRYKAHRYQMHSQQMHNPQ